MKTPDQQQREDQKPPFELEIKPLDPMDAYNREKGDPLNKNPENEIIDPTNAMRRSYEKDKAMKEALASVSPTPIIVDEEPMTPRPVKEPEITIDEKIKKEEPKSTKYWQETLARQKEDDEKRIAEQKEQARWYKEKEEEIKREKEQKEREDYEKEIERLKIISENQKEETMRLGNEAASLYQEGLRKEELNKEQERILAERKKNDEIINLMNEEQERQRLQDVDRLKTLEERNKTPEQKLEENRLAYVTAYKEHFENKSKISKTWQTLRATVGFPKTTKESDLPLELQELKKSYDESKVKFGKDLFQKEKDRLTATGKTPLEIDALLKEYKQNTIFQKIIVEEKLKLQASQVERLPKKEAGILKKSLNWYLKQPRWKKAVIATALFTGVAATIPGSALTGAGAIASYATTRLGRSLIGGQVGLGATKLYDIFNKDKSGVNRQKDEMSLKKDFAENSNSITNIKDAEQKYTSILEQEQKAKRKRIVHKALIGMAVGAGTSAVLGNLEQITDLAKKIDLPEKTEGTEIPQENTPPVTENPTEIKKPPTPPADQEIAPSTPDEVGVVESTEDVKVDFSSRGAIGTIEDLQKKLMENPELHKDAVSQEIMKGDATKLAEKFGFYKPGEINESAMLIKGGSLEIRNGNLVYHENAKDILGHTVELGNNVAGPTENWGGKMFDYNGKNSIPESGSSSTIVGENSEIINPSRPASGLKIAGENIPNNNQNEIVYTERVLPTHERINPNKIYHTEKVFTPGRTVNPEMYGIKNAPPMMEFDKNGMLKGGVPTVNPEMYGIKTINTENLLNDPNFSFHDATPELQEKFINQELHHDVNDLFGKWNGSDKVGGWESIEWQHVKDLPVRSVGKNVDVAIPDDDPYKRLMQYTNKLYEKSDHLAPDYRGKETVENYIKRALRRIEEIEYAQGIK